MLVIYGSGLQSVEPVHVVIQSSVAGFARWFFYSPRWCLLERSAQITGSMLDGREMIAERLSRNRRRIKKSDISGQRARSSPAPLGADQEGLRKDRLPRRWMPAYRLVLKARGQTKTYCWKTALWKCKCRCPESVCRSWTRTSRDSRASPPQHWKHSFQLQTLTL